MQHKVMSTNNVSFNVSSSSSSLGNLPLSFKNRDLPFKEQYEEIKQLVTSVIDHCNGFIPNQYFRINPKFLNTPTHLNQNDIYRFQAESIQFLKAHVDSHIVKLEFLNLSSEKKNESCRYLIHLMMNFSFETGINLFNAIESPTDSDFDIILRPAFQTLHHAKQKNNDYSEHLFELQKPHYKSIRDPNSKYYFMIQLCLNFHDVGHHQFLKETMSIILKKDLGSLIGNYQYIENTLDKLPIEKKHQTMELIIHFYDNVSLPQSIKTNIYRFLIMKFNDVSERKSRQLLDQLTHLLDNKTCIKLNEFLNQKKQPI